MSDPAVPFRVKATYEYLSDYDDDLTFPVGQIITVTEVEDEEWFFGNYDGKSGMFPRNFVEVIKEPPPPRSRPAPKAPEVKEAPAPELKEVGTQEDPQSAEEEPELAASPVDQPKVQIPSLVASPTKANQPKSPTSNTDGPKPPMPVFPNQKINDPYSIKKQFISTGKSSYVPKVTPRDDSNIIGHAHNQVPDNVEVVKGTSVTEEQVDEPKVSLKERIALLQKRQAEEAEREAAALKKQEERKKKLVEEKERAKARKEEEAAAVATRGPEEDIPEEPVARRSIESETSALSRTHSSSSRRGSETAHPTLETSHTAGSKDSRYGREFQDVAEQEEGGEEEAQQEDPEAVDDENEEEPDDEDDEELKRRKLVERMAKISGGRNMFGMMGMASPFGAQAPKTKRSPKKEPQSSPLEQQESGDGLREVHTESKPEEELPVSKEESESKDQVDLPKAIPILPVGNSTLPKELGGISQKTHDQEDIKDHDVTLREESPSLAEDDELTESDSKFPEAGLAQTHPEIVKPLEPPIPRPDALDSGADESSEEDNIEITRPGNETEGTGYEADEDLSDLPRPPVPTRDLPPSIPGGPPPIPKGAPAPSEPLAPAEVPTPPSRPPPVPTDIPQLSTSTLKSNEFAQSHGPPSAALPPPPPPVPSSVPPSNDLDEEDEFEEENRTVVQDAYDSSSAEENDDFPVDGYPRRSNTFAGDAPPVPTSIPPPAVPTGSVPKRASTDISDANIVPHLTRTSTGASVGSYKRNSVDSISRSRSLKERSGFEQSQAELAFRDLEYELANISGASNWWLRGELPESLAGRIGIDLVYEIESNQIKKRGDRTVNYRDYYVLFYDLSQLIFELEYESEDPRSTIHFVRHFTKPIPIIRKDLLDKYHRAFASAIVSKAATLLGTKIADDVVSVVLEGLGKTEIVKPIGHKSYGVTIYKNINNTNVAKIDEIKAGDVLWIKNGKFSSQKGLLGSKSSVLGEGNNSQDGYTSIIYEFDPKKEKFKVIESDAAGHVKKESYKIGDFKSGRIRVFRVVGKGYVGW